MDAPCSGLGVLNRRPDLRWRAEPLPDLQLALLRAAAERVKPGGTIVYSVCTLNADESEAVVDASGLEIEDLGADWPAFRHPSRPEFLLTLPHVHGTSGFFVARLRLPGVTDYPGAGARARGRHLGPAPTRSPTSAPCSSATDRWWGRARPRPRGRHGEIVALDAAGEAARGATLYVTMEPCAHHGTTPPCAEAILAAGVARVVVGSRDPNPEAAGGVERLRDGGRRGRARRLVRRAGADGGLADVGDPSGGRS